MRLAIFAQGQRLRARLAIRLIGFKARTKPDDIARIILYRPTFFGRFFMRAIREVMRGPSEWSIGERELFAAFVSRRNSCTFCSGVHSHVATLALNQPVSLDDLDDWATTQFSEPVKATLGVLAKLAGSHGESIHEELAVARAAGVSDGALIDAIYVAFVFNTINRMADVFGASYEGDEGRRLTAAALYDDGYQVPGFFLR